ncbi:MAG: hypothetical protein H7145_03060 [Akkermansiaceae bacterium]|nr:hypothetical protein [Armatimonadota bacterium]
MAETISPLVEEDERPVEEVRCIYNGTPIPTIPAWYAGVKVKFFSEASRKATAAAISLAELEAGRLRDAAENDTEDEDASDLDADLELEDVELEIEDDTEEAEPEADPV